MLFAAQERGQLILEYALFLLLAVIIVMVILVMVAPVVVALYGRVTAPV
jgi:hypothetical protein